MADTAYDLYMTLTDGTRQKVGTIVIPSGGGSGDVTKDYVDSTFVKKAGDTMTGRLAIVAQGNKIHLGTPIVGQENTNILIDMERVDTSAASGYTQWIRGGFGNTSNGYFATTVLGQYRASTTDNAGFYIGQSWDGASPDTFWYFRRNGITEFPGAIYENGQRVYSPNNPPPASGSFHLYEYTIGIDQSICMSVEGFPTIYFQIVSAQNLKVDTEHSADSLGLVGCTYPATGKFRTSITSSTWYNAVKVSISSNGFNVTDGGGNDWCGGDGPVLHSFFYEDSPYFSLFIKSKRQIV